MSVFARRLQEARKLNKITQKKHADFLKIQETSYQMYEYGKREPNYDVLIKLCVRLNTSADWLLGISNDNTIHAPANIDPTAPTLDAASERTP